MTTIDAENMIIRLTNLVLNQEAAAKQLADEHWLEERVLDVIESVNADDAGDDACSVFAHEFCEELMHSHPDDVRAGFNLDNLESDDDED